jgi:hypothetical protein
MNGNGSDDRIQIQGELVVAGSGLVFWEILVLRYTD